MPTPANDDSAPLAQVRLGASGLHVSRIALGMMSYAVDRGRRWPLDADDAEPIVRRALELGVTFFDTADMYWNGESEVVTGRLLRKLGQRDELVVATKVFYREEEREMIPQCIDQVVGLIPYSPLANGFLAGTHARSGERLTARAGESTARELYGRPVDFDTIERVARIASERGVPPARVALAWLLGKGGIAAPIVGATKPGHLEDARAAAGLELSAEDVAVLEAGYEPRTFRA